jgi:Aminoglycoside 3-N-acetyltransferase
MKTQWRRAGCISHDPIFQIYCFCLRRSFASCLLRRELLVRAHKHTLGPPILSHTEIDGPPFPSALCQVRPLSCKSRNPLLRPRGLRERVSDNSRFANGGLASSRPRQGQDSPSARVHEADELGMRRVCCGRPGVAGCAGPDGDAGVPTHTADNRDPSRWHDPGIPQSWWPTIRACLPAFDPRLTPSVGMGAVAELVRLSARTISIAISAIGRRSVSGGTGREWVTYSDVKLVDDDFAELGSAFEEAGRVAARLVGNATSRLFTVQAATAFALEWMQFHRQASPG